MSTSRRPSSSLSTRTDHTTPSSSPPTSPSSTSIQASTSASSSTSTPSTSPQDQTNPTAPIVVAVVVVLLLFCVAIAGYFIYRRRHSRRQLLQHGYERHSTFGGYQAELDDRPATSSRSMKRPGTVDKSHAATKITPFESSANLVPRFNHSPGNDMRIATRRPDGAWEFSNPGSAFNPSGVDEIEPPASASASMYSPTPSRSSFKLSMTPTTRSKSIHRSIHSSFPPTPETPSFPPGLPPATPSLLPSLPPSTPTTPLNVTTFPAASSSSSSARPASQLTTESMEPPKSPAQIMKERESRAARLIRQGYDDREFSDEAPPPAYGYDPCDPDHPNEPSLP